MNHDKIVKGEALADDCEQSDIDFQRWRNAFSDAHWSKMDLGACRLGWDAGRNSVATSTTVVNIRQDDPERAAFHAYRVAFNRNAVDPKLKHAAALVAAWNAFADVVGVDRV